MLVYDNSAEVPGTPPEMIGYKDATGLSILKPALIPELTAALQRKPS